MHQTASATSRARNQGSRFARLGRARRPGELPLTLRKHGAFRSPPLVARGIAVLLLIEAGLYWREALRPPNSVTNFGPEIGRANGVPSGPARRSERV